MNIRLLTSLLGAIALSLAAHAQTIVGPINYGAGQNVTVIGPSTIQTSGQVTVSSGANVKFLATSYIALNAGFSSSGGTFQAVVDPQAVTPPPPSFSPAPGTYPTPQSVTITDSNNTATIYYTTNGTTPSASSAVYTGPISLPVGTTTLRAIAINAAGSSPVTSGTYTVLPPPPSTPVFAPAAGTYNSAQLVSITSAGATSIYYTTDGSTPTSASILYSGPISISTTTILRVIGVNAGGSSPVASGTYTILPSAPVFAPAAGTYNATQSVSITSAGATSIYYTTDGSTPTTASTVYAGPISIATTTTLRAIGANASGLGAVTSGTYTIQPPPPSTPVFAPAAGTYNTAQSVSIMSTGATNIYYTTDGSTPTTASALYAGPISIGATTTLRAIGVNAGGSSPVASGTYTILPSAPVFAPAAGTYNSAQSVSITSVNATSIYYTTDGSTPTTASTLYAGPVAIATTTTLRAIGINASGSGPVASGTYTILPSTPVFAPAAGTYNAAQSVSITSTGATSIYYTTDGSTPTTASTLYTASVAIATTTTLRAIGINASGSGPVASGTYTILPSTPVFAPAAGTYSSAQSVSIASTGATSIYYTTDGSTPTTASTLYTAPVAIATTTTLRAIGVNASGSSPVVSGTYTILPSTPVFAPPAGTYSSAQSVNITSTGATSIYYTTDGSTPTTASTLYTGPVAITTTTTLNAIGVNASGSGAVTGGTYTILPSAPMFAPAAGTYSSAQSVSITSVNATSIYYTTDGSTPTAASTLYAGPVSIATTTTLRAIGVNAGGSSPVTSGTYTILPSTPVFAPPAGTYNGTQSVSIASTGATSIYYTTDGSTPTAASTLYAGPLSIATTTTLRAIGINASGSGQVASGTYTILPSAPVFAPAAGTYNTAQSVSIASTDATSIYYTTDGSTPTTASTLYAGPVSIATTTTLRAIGINTNGASPVTSGTYTIVPPPPSAPVFAPPAGTYNGTQSVNITSTGAASIYYTMDGSTPTTASTLYAGPVSIATTTTLRAIGVNAGGMSAVTSGTYTIVPPPPSTPVFAPPAGIYNSAQSVSITSTGATSIYYTTDGSTPTAASTLYVGPVSIATTTTLSAIGVNTGGSSPVASGTYTILPSTPVFAPAAGTYNAAQSVSITSTGATSIYYTTDGSTPTTASTLYAGPVSIATTTTLNAIGVNASGSSPVASGTYTILPSAPVFAPAAGTYSSAQSVSITCAGATSIYYTTDGSTPTTASTLYAGPVAIATTTTLRAIGANASGSGPVTSGTYTILPPPPAAPVLTPPAGTYSTAQSVSITSTGATSIYYTTDGSTPTTASTLYTGPVSIASTTTLSAIGVNAGGSSPVTSGTYTILPPPPAAPAFAPPAGTYSTAQSVSITSTGATSIYYTTDGSTPTTASTLYTGPVSIASTTTLSAIGVNAGGSSPVTSGTYTILPPPPAAPAFTPPPGTYSGIQSVSIASTGATGIYYTTDGSTPTTASTLYAGPVSIGMTTTLKAIGVNAGGSSPVTSGTYTIQVLPQIFTYDAAGRLTSAAQTDGFIINYSLDEEANLLSVSTAPTH